MVIKTVLKKLRDYLVTHGVWVKTQAGSISYAKVLQECLDSKEQHKWTEKEIENHLIEYRGMFDSKWNPESKLKDNPILPNSQNSSPIPLQSADTKLNPMQMKQELLIPSPGNSKSNIDID
ncbi:hypothetical protein GcM3_014031 [Golovinomyces cichoracearum]|uniref:Uncharacterized protein n=1 Tax=Golovinomyces cichoracearum TaxID=62708 RepID=A0A420J965_9PEZI|nr:hypothetical protein GcM3_014031 [Golovinomyces cichoracearum]